MPRTTSAEAFSGATGLTVVRACRKAQTPATHTASPAAPNTAATAQRNGVTHCMGSNADVLQIPAATNATSNSGGSLSVSQR